MSLRRRAEPGVSGGLTAAVDDREPVRERLHWLPAASYSRESPGASAPSRRRRSSSRVTAPAAGVFRVHNAARSRPGVRRGPIGTTSRVTAVHRRARAESARRPPRSSSRTSGWSPSETPERPSTSRSRRTEASWNRRGHRAPLRSSPAPRHLHVVVQARRTVAIEVEGIRAQREGAVHQRMPPVVDRRGWATSTSPPRTPRCRARCTCEGRLTARSSNGKIEIDRALRLRGRLDVQRPDQGIGLDGVDKGGVQLATSNGRIVLELPDDVDADVDIRVDNGVIRNDCPRFLCERKTDGRVRGQLGSGGAPIRLRTSNGSISLR